MVNQEMAGQESESGHGELVQPDIGEDAFPLKQYDDDQNTISRMTFSWKINIQCQGLALAKSGDVALPEILRTICTHQVERHKKSANKSSLALHICMYICYSAKNLGVVTKTQEFLI